MLLPLTLAAFGTARATAGSTTAATAATATTLCYQKRSGFSDRQDLEQLRLVLSGERVSGDYRWVPWGKDRRIGRLEGRLTAPGTARVLHRFQQEGQWNQESLSIVFNAKQARISWDANPSPGPGSPLPLPPVLLPQHACGSLQAIPKL
jgi:hypothetical protein